MKRKILILIFVSFIILLSSFISAEIIINQQPNKIYNLGDFFSVPVIIKSSIGVSGIFQMDLICGGQDINFFKNGIFLSAGEEKRLEASLILTKNLIGEFSGKCKIKGSFNDEYILTDEFKISNLINIKITSEQREFAPEENVIIEGKAIKENGKTSDGFIDLILMLDSSQNNSEGLTYSETISNGFFSISFNLPKEIKAGEHPIKLNVYEKDSSGEITNTGTADYNIIIKQIPTNLEIVFENLKAEGEPGTNLKAKAILHDQTGENIASNVKITIKNQKGKILEQTEKQTDEFFEYPIKYNEKPEEWKIIAISKDITSETNFNIAVKEQVKIELINKTIILTNTGNVPYNETVLVKVGEESININAFLKVDEVKKYILTGPDGQYQIEIISDEGSKITGQAMLTGKAIDIKESQKIRSVVKFTSWFFLILVLGFVIFVFFKRRYKKRFIGHFSKKKPKSKEKERSFLGLGGEKKISFKKGSVVKSENKAELSLSLKGDKQNASIVCFKIKNFQEIDLKKGNVQETLQEIVNIAEKNKATLYENQENLIFILVPAITRTFGNEKTAIELSQKITAILNEHNKKFNQKIKFGVSLNYGAIIAKKEKTGLKFMSLGTLITNAKKISSLANNEILLSEKMNEKARNNVKTQKQTKNGVPVFTIQEVRHKEGNIKFISEFLRRLERGNKKEQK